MTEDCSTWSDERWNEEFERIIARLREEFRNAENREYRRTLLQRMQSVTSAIVLMYTDHVPLLVRNSRKAVLPGNDSKKSCWICTDAGQVGAVAELLGACYHIIRVWGPDPEEEGEEK